MGKRIAKRIDGRRNNGGARPGGGRPKAKHEDDVRTAIRCALERSPGALDAIWDKVIELAKLGSERHQYIFFTYYYGKPKETMVIEGSPPIMLTRKIITVDGN